MYIYGYRQRKAGTSMSETLQHEGRISRLEGIIEQIDKRLGTIERVGISLLAALLAGVVSILVLLLSQ